jgi:hypothetical protein
LYWIGNWKTIDYVQNANNHCRSSVYS